MKRLTERLPNGVIKRTQAKGETAMSRLADYEDTGLTPQQVRELAKAAAARKEAPHYD